MTIWTSYFGNRKLPNIPLVSIAGKTPDAIKCFKFKKLAPKYDWWKEWKEKNRSNEWYVKKYKDTVLDNLDVTATVGELKTLTGSDEFVLLCYEKPTKDGKWFCHRSIVRCWLNMNGFDSRELPI